MLASFPPYWFPVSESAKWYFETGLNYEPFNLNVSGGLERSMTEFERAGTLTTINCIFSSSHQKILGSTFF